MIKRFVAGVLALGVAVVGASGCDRREAAQTTPMPHTPDMRTMAPGTMTPAIGPGSQRPVPNAPGGPGAGAMNPSGVGDMKPDGSMGGAEMGGMGGTDRPAGGAGGTGAGGVAP